MYINDTDKKKIAASNWYNKQKPGYGTVYELFNKNTGDLYIGSTVNSLKKRLWQHKSKGGIQHLYNLIMLDPSSWVIKELERVPLDQDLKLAEQIAISLYEPNLNKNRVQGTRRKKSCSKGGCEVFNTWFPTKHKAWLKHGVSCLNTFKRRLNRGFTLEQALTKPVNSYNRP